MRRRAGLVVATGCAVVALTSCSGSTAKVTVPASVTNAYPAHATAALCALGLHPVYVSAPALSRADAGTNGYAVKLAHPEPGGQVKAGSVVDLTLVTDVNGGDLFQRRPFAVLPNLVGVDVNKAVSEITGLGLLVDVTAATPTGSLLVAAEVPAAHTTVRGESTVRLQVGRAGSQACS
jgi:beta-lactam-binding protein with PASTA domain